MSTLEREILNYVAKLDANKQQQILEYARALADTSANAQPTLTKWLEQADAFREELVAKYGTGHFESALDTLNDVREERLNDLMGRR